MLPRSVHANSGSSSTMTSAIDLAASITVHGKPTSTASSMALR